LKIFSSLLYYPLFHSFAHTRLSSPSYSVTELHGWCPPTILFFTPSLIIYWIACRFATYYLSLSALPLFFPISIHRTSFNSLFYFFRTVRRLFQRLYVWGAHCNLSPNLFLLVVTNINIA
jgi:hypothetical protein